MLFGHRVKGVRETLKPKRLGCFAKSRARRVLLPTPEGPETTRGRAKSMTRRWAMGGFNHSAYVSCSLWDYPTILSSLSFVVLLFSVCNRFGLFYGSHDFPMGAVCCRPQVCLQLVSAFPVLIVLSSPLTLMAKSPSSTLSSSAASERVLLAKSAVPIHPLIPPADPFPRSVSSSTNRLASSTPSSTSTSPSASK